MLCTPTKDIINLLAICMSSLKKCLFKSFSHFLIELFFWHWVVWAACIFWKLILCQLFHMLLFSPSLGDCLFTLLIVSFAVQKLLSIIRSHLFTLVFYFHYFRRWVTENFALIYIIECSAYVSSKSFIVSGFTFRSLIHFEFIFVYGVRKCSNFILLHVAVQFPQDHLLRRLSFLQCIFLPTLSNIRCL